MINFKPTLEGEARSQVYEYNICNIITTNLTIKIDEDNIEKLKQITLSAREFGFETLDLQDNYNYIRLPYIVLCEIQYFINQVFSQNLLNLTNYVVLLEAQPKPVMGFPNFETIEYTQGMDINSITNQYIVNSFVNYNELVDSLKNMTDAQLQAEDYSQWHINNFRIWANSI